MAQKMVCFDQAPSMRPSDTREVRCVIRVCTSASYALVLLLQLNSTGSRSASERRPVPEAVHQRQFDDSTLDP